MRNIVCMMILYRTAKFKSAKLFACADLGESAKFNSLFGYTARVCVCVCTVNAGLAFQPTMLKIPTDIARLCGEIIIISLPNYNRQQD